MVPESQKVSVLTTIVDLPRISWFYVDQLEDERPPGHDPSAPGQQIPAHQALQH